MNFSELNALSEDRVAEIRRKGCVVIRDVVDDEEARRASLNASVAAFESRE